MGEIKKPYTAMKVPATRVKKDDKQSFFRLGDREAWRRENRMIGAQFCGTGAMPGLFYPPSNHSLGGLPIHCRHTI